ncbi:E3 ubiquitin-protein ligase RNF12-B isoform X2 [Teleopsis dalmanni]|uniref:E3 ubiquitin-protein ligase RNF12-B isoform X2 n=1 Tax=Teleopsis dalmanni TaxID=139649 RepID=UPI0018CF5636|nr:E3 ubiquitin-protein ligase RNF12-B isoform X2 [Teleopsis dalmanni]
MSEIKKINEAKEDNTNVKDIGRNEDVIGDDANSSVSENLLKPPEYLSPTMEKKTPVKRTPSKRRSFVERAQKESEELVRNMGGSLELEGGRRTRSSSRGTPTHITPPPIKKAKVSPATPKTPGRGRGRKLNVSTNSAEEEENIEKNKKKPKDDAEKNVEKEENIVDLDETEAVKVDKDIKTTVADEPIDEPIEECTIDAVDSKNSQEKNDNNHIPVNANQRKETIAAEIPMEVDESSILISEEVSVAEIKSTKSEVESTVLEKKIVVSVESDEKLEQPILESADVLVKETNPVPVSVVEKEHTPEPSGAKEKEPSPEPIVTEKESIADAIDEVVETESSPKPVAELVTKQPTPEPMDTDAEPMETDDQQTSKLEQLTNIERELESSDHTNTESITEEAEVNAVSVESMNIQGAAEESADTVSEEECTPVITEESSTAVTAESLKAVNEQKLPYVTEESTSSAAEESASKTITSVVIEDVTEVEENNGCQVVAPDTTTKTVPAEVTLAQTKAQVTVENDVSMEPAENTKSAIITEEGEEAVLINNDKSDNADCNKSAQIATQDNCKWLHQ